MLTLGGELLGEGLRKAVSHLGVSATLLGNPAEGLGRVEGAVLLTLYAAYLALAVSRLGV